MENGCCIDILTYLHTVSQQPSSLAASKCFDFCLSSFRYASSLDSSGLIGLVGSCLYGCSSIVRLYHAAECTSHSVLGPQGPFRNCFANRAPQNRHQFYSLASPTLTFVYVA